MTEDMLMSSFGRPRNLDVVVGTLLSAVEDLMVRGVLGSTIVHRRLDSVED
jgi:hypothetical protein